MADHTFASGEALTAANMNAYAAHTGGQWNSWTPTVTQSGSVTCTVTYGRYYRSGRLIVASCRLDMTSSGTSSNAVTIGNLPATAASSGFIVGTGEFYNVSGPGSNFKFSCLAYLASTTALDLRWIGSTAVDNRIGLVTGATEALASTDVIALAIQYEAATG